MEVPYPDHRRPLYLEAQINDVFVRRALVDTGSSLNIIPLYALKAAGIPQSRIVKSGLKISGFAEADETSIGYIQLDLRCVKGRIGLKPIRIPRNQLPFHQSEAHYIEDDYYNEFTTDEGPAKTSGVPLPSWQDIRDISDSDLPTAIRQAGEASACAQAAPSHYCGDGASPQRSQQAKQEKANGKRTPCRLRIRKQSCPRGLPAVSCLFHSAKSTSLYQLARSPKRYKHLKRKERSKTHLTLTEIAVKIAGFSARQQQLRRFVAASRRRGNERRCPMSGEETRADPTRPAASTFVDG
ncbi:hypothetical protein ACLB2K_036904 [Fragaria x ananassa]